MRDPGRRENPAGVLHFQMRSDKEEQMIDVLELLMQEEPDSWCPKFYHGGAFEPLGTPLWGIHSSVSGGIVAHETVPLKGNQPFDGLWRLHYATLTKKMESLSLSKFDIDSQEDMKRRIAVLCQRNKYPANSLAHIYVWREGRELNGKTDYAIFQSRLPRPAFDNSGLKLIILDASKEETININAGAWADVAVESAARRKTAERSKAELIDYAGMALINPNGKVVRTTIGNVYLTIGRKVIGVKEGEGATPCALRPFLKTAIDEINMGYDARLAISYKETDGLDNAMITEANSCFVLDSAIGLAPIMRMRTTFRNDLARILEDKFRRLF